MDTTTENSFIDYRASISRYVCILWMRYNLDVSELFLRLFGMGITNYLTLDYLLMF